MGYDIGGPDGIEMHLPMLAFNKLLMRGYDWFGTIGAPEADGMYSGTGIEKEIRLRDLEKGLKEIERVGKEVYPILKKLGIDDPFAHYEPIVRQFTRECIDWCKKQKKDSVTIEFA
jgi:hypothetical protein